jgi:hypothetical protein
MKIDLSRNLTTHEAGNVPSKESLSMHFGFADRFPE